MSFNPSEHLMKLGKSDYLEVRWRLVWFREQCPNGTIDTEEIVVDLDRVFEVEATRWVNNKKETYTKVGKGYARYKAVVTNGLGGRATGTKSESAVDFPDFIEKAETGAIGRALAALGYGTQFAPDLEEGHRIVDSPVEPRAPQNGHAQPTSDAVSLSLAIKKVKERAYAQGVATTEAWLALLAKAGVSELVSLSDVTKVHVVLNEMAKQPVAVGG